MLQFQVLHLKWFKNQVQQNYLYSLTSFKVHVCDKMDIAKLCETVFCDSSLLHQHMQDLGKLTKVTSFISLALKQHEHKWMAL